MESDWHDFLARQEILVAMRFSYFGNSGWKSDFSKTKDLLFEKSRLMMRLALLSSLPLPSLAAQTDQNFHLMVLCSQAMPSWAKQALQDACETALPQSQFTICPRWYGFAHLHLSRFLADRYGSGAVIQTVLDDDDGFATDMIASIRHAMARLAPPSAPEDLRFATFIDGYGIDISEKEPVQFQLYEHRYPYINLGLTMVAHSGGKNLFSIRHRKTPQEHPCQMVKGRPMFVRSVHQTNDSRVEVSNSWKPVADWRNDAGLRARFPYLPLL